MKYVIKMRNYLGHNIYWGGIGMTGGQYWDYNIYEAKLFNRKDLAQVQINGMTARDSADTPSPDDLEIVPVALIETVEQ